MAFRGLYEHSLDSKNRLSVPAKFRADFASGLVLSQDPDEQCLGVWTPEAHEATAEAAFAGKDPLDKDYKRQQREFFGHSFDIDLDANGRITIREDLREHAGIERDVVVVGVRTHLEIWSKARWDSMQEAGEG